MKIPPNLPKYGKKHKITNIKQIPPEKYKKYKKSDAIPQYINTYIFT